MFFSLISPDKGIELILEAADMVPNAEFHLCGRIEEGCGERFERELMKRMHVKYHGVFDSVGGEVLFELNNYDVHLFLTPLLQRGCAGCHRRDEDDGRSHYCLGQRLQR